VDFWSVLTDRARLEGSDGGGAEPSGVPVPSQVAVFEGFARGEGSRVSARYSDGAVPEEDLGLLFHT